MRQSQPNLPRRRTQARTASTIKHDVGVSTTPSRVGSKSRYHVRALSKRLLFPIIAMPLLCLLNGVAYYSYWRIEAIFLSYDGFAVSNGTMTAETSPAKPAYYVFALCLFFYLVMGNVFIVRPGVGLLVAEMMEHHREELANRQLLKFALLTAILGAPHAAVAALRDPRVPRDEERRALPVTNSSEGLFVMVVLGVTWALVVFSLWLWWTSLWVNKLANGVRRFADASLAQRRQIAEEELRQRLAGRGRALQHQQQPFHHSQQASRRASIQEEGAAEYMDGAVVDHQARELDPYGDFTDPGGATVDV